MASNISTERICFFCNNTEFIYNADTLTAKPCVCREQKKTERLLASSGLTKYQRQVKLTDFKLSDKTTLLMFAIKQYMNEYKTIHKSDSINKGLAVIGSVGIGKTMILTGIANVLIDMGIPVVFVATPDLIAELRTSQFSDNGLNMDCKINNLSTVPVCIFDDVAKEKPSEWVQTQYYRILDMRYRLRLTTLFSANFTFDQIADRLGDAISSRLYALTKERQFYLEADDYRVYGAV